jgi:asparagine synthase (glutamine-hydrolysing)
LQEISVFDEAARSQLYTEEFLSQLPAADPYDLLRAALAQSRGRDPITAVSLADVQTSLPGLHLAACDWAAARRGLGCRHPFLDAQVAELAAAVPGRWKWRRGVGTRILREACADLLPAEVLRRGHRPFALPIPWPLVSQAKDWLTGNSALSAAISRESLTRLCEELPANGTECDDSSALDDERRERRIWALAMLEHWLRQCSG